jgi:hypothetical protein
VPRNLIARQIQYQRSGDAWEMMIADAPAKSRSIGFRRPIRNRNGVSKLIDKLLIDQFFTK